MARSTHVLRPVEKSERPTNVIFVDTETRQHEIEPGTLRHTFRLGNARYCRTRRGETLRLQSQCDFYDIDDFWQWALAYTADNRKLYLVSHNLNYDLPVLDAFIRLANLGYELTQFYSSGMTNIFRWKNGKSYIVAIDNGNFFAGKLDKWGKVVNMPKLSVDFETDDDETLMIYCRRDVEIMQRLWQVWIDFLDQHNIGRFKLTVASTAFEAFRHRFMGHHIQIHVDPDVLALERAAYHGGRTEAFYKGRADDSTYYYLDFNSMYPYVMREFDYPVWLWGYRQGPSLPLLRYQLERSAVIARVRLKNALNAFPVLKNERLIYPTESFDATLSTPELTYALEHEWIAEVYEMSWYKQRPIFRQYVDYFYSERKKYEAVNQHDMAQLTKLMLNSLYGKFGQRGIDQKKIANCDPEIVRYESVYDLEDNETYNLTYLGGSVIKTIESGESFNSFPAVAAHVTAYARMHLWSYIEHLPQQTVYYCDTDSLLVNQRGYDALKNDLHDTRLGALKIETQSDWIEIRAPKDYAMQGRNRIKGISASAEQVRDNDYRQMQWKRIRGMIHEGNLSEYHTRYVIKHLKREIKTGLVSQSGWIVPFVLPL